MEIWTNPNSNNRYIINNTDRASEFYKREGLPEQSLIDWCSQYLNDYQDFVDVGSNIGAYSIELSKYCNFVHAFEATKLTYFSQCGSIALNKKLNVKLHNVALGDECEASAKIYHTTHDHGGSSLIKPAYDREIIGCEYVDMRTLDSYELDNVGFIKCDIEGYELKFLQGATQTLIRNDYPKILFESNKDNVDRKELFDYLISLGYFIHPIINYSHMFLATRKNT